MPLIGIDLIGLCQILIKVIQTLTVKPCLWSINRVDFVPILVLAAVGTVLVLNETGAAAQSQQRHTAAALLTRYEHTASNLLRLVELRPDQYDQALRIMQSMYNERYLKRAAIIDQKAKSR